MKNQEIILADVPEIKAVTTDRAKELLGNFSAFLEKASEWEQKARSLIVTDESQKDLMKSAHEGRMILKNLRGDVEDKRKEMKEQSLREGKAIDGIANAIKAVIIPLEEHLEKQEKFAENIENARKQALYEERVEKLAPYVSSVVAFDLKNMTDEAFNEILSGQKMAYEARIAAEKKADDERIAKEKTEKEEQERMKIENDRLKKEAEEAEKERAKEKAEDDKKLKVAQDKADKEAAEKKKLEDEIRSKKEAEDKAEADRIAKEKEAEKERKAAEKKARLAPDKDKLFAWAEEIKNLKTPEGLSLEAQAIVATAQEDLLAISQRVKTEINKL
jgi:hypothetical protein